MDSATAIQLDTQSSDTPAYAPHLKQIEAHKAFLLDGYDRGTLFWGRQVGKSLWSIKHLEMAALKKQGQYFIVFATHKHAKDVMWRQYLHMIPKELINWEKTNATDLLITFNHIKGPMFLPGIGWIAVKHNRKLPASTIQLLGSDYSDDHRGRKADGMIFDEYQDQDPDAWESVYKYFFTTTKGWACFMGTAKGYNHWYELLEFAREDKRWFYLQATWRDNPAVDATWIERERDEAERRDQLDIFMQEVELQFRTVQGSVFPRFDRNVHMLDASDHRIPTESTIYVGWDFGWVEGHPTAINVIEIDQQGKWFITDEIHGTELELEDAARMLAEKIGTRKITAVIPDSARPDLIALLKKELAKYWPNIHVIGANKSPHNSVSSIVTGIQLLSQKIRPKPQLLGYPEPDFYILSHCKYTLYDFENYKYREHKPDRPANELPVKMSDDHVDDIRYVILHLKYGIKQERSVYKPTVKFNQYGL